MATWIWRWRRTMLEKARWIALTAFRRFAKLASTSRKCRMLISGQARDAWKGCGAIRAQFAKTPIPAAELFSPTIKASRTVAFSPAGPLINEGGAKDGGGRHTSTGGPEGGVGWPKFFYKGVRPLSPGFVSLSPAFLCC